ncbi:MAG TPA: hypothetical protein DD613_05620 [Firmicutes bacterium]|nr:hypothetical protein [Bacillota bacterium]
MFLVEEINVNVTDIDGKEYIELDTVEVKGSKYVYLVSTNDDKDFLINKIVLDNGKEYYESLESNEEFQIVLLNFIKKNKSVINEL